VRHALPDITITIAGEQQRSSSTIATVGGYVVVVASTLPAAAITLTSCYLGQISGDTAATHLLLTPAGGAEFEHRIVPGQLGEDHARACLLDHAAELQVALTPAEDIQVQIDVGPVALTRAAAAWSQPAD